MSLTAKTLLVVAQASELTDALTQGIDGELRCCAASGSSERASLELGLDEDLAGVHKLVLRLGALLDEERPARVICPALDVGSLSQRALAAGMIAALSLREARSVQFINAAGELEEPERDSHAVFAERLRAAHSSDATAVISTWNKASDVRENLTSLRAQTRLFSSVVVVDNASSDETAKMITEEFPEVRLIVMPNSAYGACETFNVGFASSQTGLTAILDDDIVMSPGWLERSSDRLAKEPPTTAILSTKIVEPEMPESYSSAPGINNERYMSTFRGCASLARTGPLRESGYYDERLFIYGNERDLTCRLLHRGYRVLQFPSAEVFHKTPFGIKMGKRSLYYHARNAWITMLKYAPLGDLVRLPFLVVSKVLLRSNAVEAEGEVTDATGTIGIGRSIRETRGAWLILLRASFSVLANVPYCLRNREPVHAPDFELPLK